MKSLRETSSSVLQHTLVEQMLVNAKCELLQSSLEKGWERRGGHIQQCRWEDMETELGWLYCQHLASDCDNKQQFKDHGFERANRVE